MKKIASFIMLMVIAASLAGCATYQPQEDRTPEMHPGHTGHEMHY